MQQALEVLLRKRRDRCIAICLGVKERDVDSQLSPEARRRLRKVILDQFNEFYDLVVDIAGSLDNGDVLLNEEYLAKIDEVHQAIVDGNAASPRPQRLVRSG